MHLHPSLLKTKCLRRQQQEEAQRARRAAIMAAEACLVPFFVDGLGPTNLGQNECF